MTSGCFIVAVDTCHREYFGGLVGIHSRRDTEVGESMPASKGANKGAKPALGGKRLVGLLKLLTGALTSDTELICARAEAKQNEMETRNA